MENIYSSKELYLREKEIIFNKYQKSSIKRSDFDPVYTLSAAKSANKKLVAEFNKLSDIRENNLSAGTTRHAAIPNPGRYFLHLVNLQENYDNDLPYSARGICCRGKYNSNGYVRGLIEAAGGTSTANFKRFYGGKYPVPKQEFD